MPVTKAKKKPTDTKERMNFRLSAEIKARVVRAAAITGQALTDFAISTLNERANEILERYDNIVLSQADYNFFLEALTSDKKPSKRSRQAAERYRQGQRKGVRYKFGD
jgi:uncharacterized protein (DUF1778 family)